MDFHCCCCSVTNLFLTLCDPVDCSTPGFLVLHCLPEFVQIHVHWVSDAIQPSHPLLSSSPPAFSLSQWQCPFQWVGSLHQIANISELQLQHQSLQWISSAQFSRSVMSNSLRPLSCSMPGLPVHHQLPEFTQTHAHWVSDAIQPSHPLSSPSPPAPNPSQHQGLFQWVSSSHEVAKVLEFQHQHQSFQWTPRTDLL